MFLALHYRSVLRRRVSSVLLSWEAFFRFQASEHGCGSGATAEHCSSVGGPQL